MKALSVHGAGAPLERTSCSVGRRGQYALPGMERLSGLDGKTSLEDMRPSSSASQPEKTEDGEGSREEDGDARNEGGFSFLDLLIAVSRNVMGEG